jgi:membrane-bound metal-dependent hydrolase YbcI (DUF457 family)
MKRNTHLLIGGMLFLVYFSGIITIFKNSTDSFWFGLLATAVGSVFPDLLEPATNRMHRGVCHGKRALKLAAVLFGVTAFIGLFSDPLQYHTLLYPASCFFLGYSSHLVADSTTRSGLPP